VSDALQLAPMANQRLSYLKKDLKGKITGVNIVTKLESLPTWDECRAYTLLEVILKTTINSHVYQTGLSHPIESLNGGNIWWSCHTPQKRSNL
jgi:hypothetical protein